METPPEKELNSTPIKKKKINQDIQKGDSKNKEPNPNLIKKKKKKKPLLRFREKYLLAELQNEKNEEKVQKKEFNKKLKSIYIDNVLNFKNQPSTFKT
jgi:hypothetical protein